MNRLSREQGRLFQAIETQNVFTIDRLLGQNFSVNEEVLRAVGESGSIPIAQIFIDHGYLHAEDDALLASAASAGHLELVNFLIQAGANLHDILPSAVAGGNMDVVRLLVEQGVNIHENNEDALQTAIAEKNREMIRFLVQRGANINHPRVLNQIYSIQDILFIEFLRKTGAEINMRTLLERGVVQGRVDVIEYYYMMNEDLNPLEELSVLAEFSHHYVHDRRFNALFDFVVSKTPTEHLKHVLENTTHAHFRQKILARALYNDWGNLDPFTSELLLVLRAELETKILFLLEKKPPLPMDMIFEILQHEYSHENIAGALENIMSRGVLN